MVKGIEKIKREFFTVNYKSSNRNSDNLHISSLSASGKSRKRREAFSCRLCQSFYRYYQLWYYKSRSGLSQWYDVCRTFQRDGVGR